VSPYELVAGTFLIVVLIGVVGYFSRQELRNLRRVRTDPAASPEEQQRARNRTWRRLALGALLLVLAVQLLGEFQLEIMRRQLMPEGEEPLETLSAEQRSFARMYTYYWIVFLLLLMAVLFIAGYDLWSLRRWSLAEHRRLNSDRREMIKEEVALYRRQRNGQQHP
jgi:hypothetical protein